ncbi:hypothetical protein V2L05_09555 [Pseudomonas alliivorans]|uniref:Lipoprotein n=1 Tax=Pseudomonas alliivorans TaxID=2810613 RepID=A0ABS4C1A4_9PSED|nr:MULTISPECIES: hypothetical protein [Pseudomonas]MBP0940796.1 hypothetical protein [Pseudomonas alliivorans]MBP0944421.1 hypothetical protein [Pseudomonas alliivorans]MBP0950433.1 hypothetical protein [Pseudomonas alliivorans]MEE4307160.1 hypothetical protein [Pseudomonas alliivorans]MEE4325286.1 hypothetical protein [Pseudomonas alliivorans]
MYRTARITLLGLALGLSACAVQPPAPTSQEPIQSLPGGQQPGAPRPTPTPNKPPVKAPSTGPKTSASFAPPPGGNSHWDARMGVYVMDDQSNTFYRQRTYYQWNNGWSWSTSPNGPWQPTDASGVPAGLGRQFSN